MFCIICNSKAEYYFTKTYSEDPYDQMMSDIGTVEYFRCQNCGFVFSKTHFDLSSKQWKKLNSQFHHYFEKSGDKLINQPPYLEMAMMIRILGAEGIINIENMIDYAAGYGTLSKLLEKYFQIRLLIFDPYIQNGGKSRYIDRENLKTYKTVINSAMFEHILSRKDLDRVNDLVDSDGCLIIHTLVCESVPNDPDWFYLQPPVHTAFHTNKSMGLLMEEWGYHSSIYCPKSKCWVLLRRHSADINEHISVLNEELQSNWFYYKEGFMDYWKGF